MFATELDLPASSIYMYLECDAILIPTIDPLGDYFKDPSIIQYMTG